MILKQFLRDISIYSVSGLLVRMISFLLIPIYVRVLATEDYGIIDLVTSISYFSGVLISFEIYQAIARFFPESDKKNRIMYASTGLYFMLFVFLLLAFLLNLFATPLSKFIFGISGKEQVLLYAGVTLFINSAFNYFQTILRYTLQSIRYSLSNILLSISTIAFSIYFVVVCNFGLEGVYMGQIFGGVLGLTLAIYYNSHYISISFSFKALKKLLYFSFPLISAGVAMYALIYMDRALIQHFLSLSDLGIYGVCFRVASIPVTVMGFISASFIPVVYKAYMEENTKKELEIIYRFTFLFGCLAITCISIFSHDILNLMTTPEYAAGFKVIPFLLLSGFLLQFSTMFLGLNLISKTKITAFIYVLGCVLSLFLNFWLIPVFGILGAGITSALISSVILYSQFYFSQKYFYVPFNLRPYFIGSIVSGLFIFLTLFVPENSKEIDFLTKIAITTLYLITMLLFLFSKHLWQITSKFRPTL